MSKASDVAVIGDRLRPFRPRSTMNAAVALAAIVGALIPCGAGSADAPRTVEGTSLAAPESAPIATRHVHITAQLINQSGTPLAGAVLVSSAGGQAVTDDDGRAEIDVAVDQSAQSVRVTGVANDRGQNLVGSTIVNLTGNDDDRIAAGTIMLASGTECEPAWVPTFGGHPGMMDGQVTALAVFDDGSGHGPTLYAGGSFTTAGGVTTRRVARWDGEVWSALGTGLNGIVFAMTVFDDGLGGGPALYAGGVFSTAGGVTANRIAKWNGTEWSALGAGVGGTGSVVVYDLAVFDDGLGGGPALYAGGTFATAGGATVNRIARWNGEAWSALGTGVDATIRALTVFDDGSGDGPSLYAGGNFIGAGGVTVNRIAKWNGTTWSALGTGVDNTIGALAVFDDGMGGGPSLYAGGFFTMAGGVPVNSIAKWNGTAWSTLGTGVSGAGSLLVSAMTVFDDGLGGGPALYAGGMFTTAGGVPANRIAKWNGTTWSALGTGVNDAVGALTVFDDGSGGGPALCSGGFFSTAGGVTVNRIAKWNGTAWSALGTGVTANVYALAVYEDGLGGGPSLYAGGSFTSAGGVTVNRIARWNGTTWSALGTGVSGTVLSLTVLNNGRDGGPVLYAGGGFLSAGGAVVNGIARWDGRAWSALGTGMNGVVSALTAFDDGSSGGPLLYAAGSFTTAGGVTVNRIAKWSGATWSALGAGLDAQASSLKVFDDGSGRGQALYAGGGFMTAGGVMVNSIARWDGRTWSALDSGMNGHVYALTVFDDGSGDGPALYAGGSFTTAGGAMMNGIARWNGRAWSALDTGMTGWVRALTVFDDGTGGGPALHAGGSFTTAGGVSAMRIAQWNGETWSALGSGVNGTVYALGACDDGSDRGIALYVGGAFSVSPAGDSFLARWGCEEFGPPCEPADFNCDRVVDGTDLTILLGEWGPCELLPCVPDINGDGLVDGRDLAILLGVWG